jgi:hypothetical protein
MKERFERHVGPGPRADPEAPPARERGHEPAGDRRALARSVESVEDRTKLDELLIAKKR